MAAEFIALWIVVITPFNLSIADLHMINLPSADLLIYKR